MGYSISKEGNAPHQTLVEKIKYAKPPTENQQLKTFFGKSNHYGKMISDFKAKMLPPNGKRKCDFSRGKLKPKTSEDINYNTALNHLYTWPYILQIKVRNKKLTRFICKKDI